RSTYPLRPAAPGDRLAAFEASSPAAAPGTSLDRRCAGGGATPDVRHELLAPIVAILAGTLAWAAGSLYARPPRVPRSLALSAGMSLTAGGALLLAASWSAGELTGFSLRGVSSTSLAAVRYLVVFGSLVGFSAYSWLLHVAPPS